MRTHIEYDDFGEYIEELDDLQDDWGTISDETGGVNFVLCALKKVMIAAAAMAVMFGTSSYAACISACGPGNEVEPCQIQPNTVAQ